METTTEQFVPVTDAFWTELSKFLKDESINGLETCRVELQYGTENREGR